MMDFVGPHAIIEALCILGAICICGGLIILLAIELELERKK